MAVHRLDDVVYVDLKFDERHRGAPGLAHGGAISAACDDLFGFVVGTIGELAVTRTLTVDYLAPVPLGAPHRITARLKLRNGRRLHLEATGVGNDGVARFGAQAVFIVVEPTHFRRYGADTEVEELFGISRPDADD